jgi:hypothetical protein
MLEYLSIIFQDYFEAKWSEDSFYTLKITAGQEFSAFYTEFSRLASVGRIPSLT